MALHLLNTQIKFDSLETSNSNASNSYSSTVPPHNSFQGEINHQFTLQFNQIFNKLHSLFDNTKAFQDKQNILDELELLEKRLSSAGVETLKKIPTVGISKGRPKREKRDPIGVEWARLNLSQRMSGAKKKKASSTNKKRGISEVDEPQIDEVSSKKFKGIY